jgi:predicted DNA-binding transcriptional regulator AlpA
LLPNGSTAGFGGCPLEELLCRKRAARLLGLSVRTLERYRVSGAGPRFCRIGRLVRYRQCDIEAWIAQSLCASIAEEPCGVGVTGKNVGSRSREKKTTNRSVPLSATMTAKG